LCSQCVVLFLSVKRNRDSDGHLPRDWFRFNVWYPACKKAKLEPRPRLHDLRHSHASWLLAEGSDLKSVMDRMGHAQITTTMVYTHLTHQSTQDTLRLMDERDQIKAIQKEELRKKIAAHLLEAPLEDLELVDGQARVRGAPASGPRAGT
jgi:hypothetical protein